MPGGQLISGENEASGHLSPPELVRQHNTPLVSPAGVRVQRIDSQYYLKLNLDDTSLPCYHGLFFVASATLLSARNMTNSYTRHARHVCP